MSNILKIYDLNIFHKEDGNATTFYHLAKENEELKAIIQKTATLNESIDRKIVFDSFYQKLNNDLNTEKLKNERNKKIVKKFKNKKEGKLFEISLEKDFDNNLIYGLLHGGKITENSMLETLKLTNKEGVEDIEYEYNFLDGDRIYDQLFFMIHISFEVNVARMFVLSRRNSVLVDDILKIYFSKKLFKAKNFKSTQICDFIPNQYRQEVLGRVLVSGIHISSSDNLITEVQEEQSNYKVEIILKPEQQNTLNQIREFGLDFFRNTKVDISGTTSEDEQSIVKLKIKDPVTGAENTIAYTDIDKLIPRIVLENEQVMDENNSISSLKMKNICLPYVSQNNQVI